MINLLMQQKSLQKATKKLALLPLRSLNTCTQDDACQINTMRTDRKKCYHHSK